MKRRFPFRILPGKYRLAIHGTKRLAKKGGTPKS